MAVGSSPACPAHSSPIFCASSFSSSWEPCWVSRRVWASCWRAEPHRCPRMSCQSLTPRTAWPCASSSSSSPRKTQERPGNVGMFSQGSTEPSCMTGEAWECVSALPGQHRALLHGQRQEFITTASPQGTGHGRNQGSNVEIQFMEGEFLLSLRYFTVLY